ncbi:hypothetical protein CMI38_01390 [Candidatus Pacearchaeota archaeon]|jgi:hypothetical protein|nr:hypothetical protein [Candidatus Pacearchaeota archaeon]|tara:strand:- start:2982 stop:3482 length:501 start_codon:yes stop_codon:yes gene_type:complete
MKQTLASLTNDILDSNFTTNTDMNPATIVINTAAIISITTASYLLYGLLIRPKIARRKLEKYFETYRESISIDMPLKRKEEIEDGISQISKILPGMNRLILNKLEKEPTMTFTDVYLPMDLTKDPDLDEKSQKAYEELRENIEYFTNEYANNWRLSGKLHSYLNRE